jgi:hypothetical protein
MRYVRCSSKKLLNLEPRQQPNEQEHLPWSAFLMPSASSVADGTGLGMAMVDMTMIGE